MTGEHGRGGRRSRQGGDLTGKQQHSFSQGGCQRCYSPAQDLAQGAHWALRNCVRVAGPCPIAVGKPATVLPHLPRTAFWCLAPEEPGER